MARSMSPVAMHASGRVRPSFHPPAPPNQSYAQRFHARHIASANTGSGVAQHSRPLFGKISSTSTPSAAWSARRCSIVRPLVLRRTSSGSMRLRMCRSCSGRSNDCWAWTVGVAAPRLTSCGRLPSVIIHSEPSSWRSRRGMRSRYSGSMWSARYVDGSWAWQSADDQVELVRIVRAGRTAPAGGAGRLLPPCVLRGFRDRHRSSQSVMPACRMYAPRSPRLRPEQTRPRMTGSRISGGRRATAVAVAVLPAASVHVAVRVNDGPHMIVR